MHTIGPGLWGIAATLAIVAGYLSFRAIDQIWWFRRLPSRGLSLGCMCLLIATGFAVWAATRYTDVEVAAAGFGPGWTCPNLGKASAMVCFRDEPITPSSH
ncbi:hypothetical protein [Inquilinus sp. CA228]|uniref:hypothetical protein n=1 Tax=Inquilinus sp. CA228 TaxID=3455609 RepID=UPI003F8D2F5E